MKLVSVVNALLLATVLQADASVIGGKPFERVLASRQSGTSSATRVDLGYEVYEGVANATTGLNVFKGCARHCSSPFHLADPTRIRFAAPPTGSLRWQAPQPPTVNRSTVLPAVNFAAQCPQSPRAGGIPNFTLGADEDCLFLNVYAPANATNLPVLVWIHGGGYGQGNGRTDMSPIINANGNNFIGVAIQYRVGESTVQHGWLLISDPARRVWLSLLGRSVPERRRQRRYTRPTSRPALGPVVYWPLWRECLAGDDLWPVCWRWFSHAARHGLRGHAWKLSLR